MVSYYHTQYSQGSTCDGNQRAYVMLYPNTSNEYSNCGSGSNVTSPLDGAFDQLYTAGSIVYYDISRFHAKDYKFPNVDTSSYSKISTQFENLLTDGDKNGTGTNLKNIRGCHMLVHSDNCTTDTAGGEKHDTCNSGGTAFSRGVMMWTGLCSDTGLRKNSSIQECIHAFIRGLDDQVKPLLGDGNGDGIINSPDEHTLGVIDSYDNVSPLLTYHGEEFTKAGDCKRSSDTVNGYDQTLTSCTEDAVYYTANDQCNPQDSNIC